LNEHLNLLISLQSIDSDILSVAEEIELLPSKLAEAKASLKEAKAFLEKIKSEHEKSDKEKKNKEGELEEIQEKLNKLSIKSTEIKTNKEYEAHLKEIKTFENNKYQIEEEILSIMEALDASGKELKKGETKLKNAEEDFSQKEKALEVEKKKLYSEMETQKAKRKDLVVRIDKEIYEKYMNIINSAGGLAVVQTQEEVCLGCHTNIPPQLYNDIKNGRDIFTCYHCNRFLFYSPDSDLPGADKKK